MPELSDLGGFALTPHLATWIEKLFTLILHDWSTTKKHTFNIKKESGRVDIVGVGFSPEFRTFWIIN